MATDLRTLPSATPRAITDELDERKLPWTTRTVELDDIDTDRSTRNQARFLPVHQDTIEIYRAAMENGAAFPAIVVSGRKKPYLTLDGNHRVLAAKMAGFTAIDALIVTGVTRQAEELYTYAANARHGLPTTLSERLAQGAYLIALGNDSHDVATALNIPVERLQREAHRKRTEERLAALGFEVESLSKNILRRLSPLPDTTMLALATLIRDFGIGTVEAGELTTAVNSIRTGEADQLAFITAARGRHSELAVTTSNGALVVPRDVRRLVMATRLIANVDVEQLTKDAGRVADPMRLGLARDVLVSVNSLARAAHALKQA